MSFLAEKQRVKILIRLFGCYSNDGILNYHFCQAELNSPSAKKGMLKFNIALNVATLLLGFYLIFDIILTILCVIGLRSTHACQCHWLIA